MASAVVANEIEEDFVTCSVCHCEYDDWNLRPKFLPHTICLSCLKVFF